MGDIDFASKAFFIRVPPLPLPLDGLFPSRLGEDAGVADHVHADGLVLAEGLGEDALAMFIRQQMRRRRPGPTPQWSIQHAPSACHRVDTSD